MQKEIKVNFPIEWNRTNGKVNKSFMLKMANYLITNKMLKNGVDYFITDSNNVMSVWGIEGKGEYNYYPHKLSVEFTCDDTEKGCDWYNALYFGVKKGKVDKEDYEFESYKVC